jgi:hypothetical protein
MPRVAIALGPPVHSKKWLFGGVAGNTGHIGEKMVRIGNDK